MGTLTLERTTGSSETGGRPEFFSSLGKRLEKGLIAALDELLERLDRAREMRQFVRSGDRALKDIGLTPDDIGRWMI